MTGRTKVIVGSAVAFAWMALAITHALGAGGAGQVSDEERDRAGLVLLRELTMQLRADVEELVEARVPARTIWAWDPTTRWSQTDRELNTPAGWVFCDGNMECPDLRGRFVRGMTTIEDLLTEGGALEHGHSSGGGHAGRRVDNGRDRRVANDGHSHSVGMASSLPPFVSLFRVMRKAAFSGFDLDIPERAGVDQIWSALNHMARTVDELEGAGVPSRAVVAWYPTRTNVDDDGRIVPPDGWFLCNGRNGTPNLVGRFVHGAASFENVGEEGGANTHSHGLAASPHISGGDNGGDHVVSGAGHTHVASGSSLPPLVRLAYIMKR